VPKLEARGQHLPKTKKSISAHDELALAALWVGTTISLPFVREAKMKSMAIALAAVMLCATQASAADSGVSKATLNDMGLGTVRPLTDDEGLTVRGKGSFAGVWGGSTASWPGGQASSNNYSAGSSWLGKGSSAGGNSYSFAGNFQFQGFAGF
jgi:hypothetical protein